MDDFFHTLHTLFLATGLLLSCYLMSQGWGDYMNHNFEPARGKMLVGLGLAIFSGCYGYTHMMVTVDGLKLILYPVLYGALALGLNSLLGQPFTDFPL